jgi:hypothetical protein
MLRPLMHPDHRNRITREKFRAMTTAMFRDDARLRREILAAAMRMLGREAIVLPDSAFALPQPATARGLWRRWGDYARMIANPEWYACRLARRLARIGCDACRRDASAPDARRATERTSPARDLNREGVTPRAGLPRARAPPFALIGNLAPCKRPLAGSPAHA